MPNLADVFANAELPAIAPAPNGMRVLRDGEISELLVGRRIAAGPVSFFENYLPNGRFVLEQDLGIRRSGSYIIERDAVCSFVPGDAETYCFRLYRAADGKVFRVFPGHQNDPQPVNFVESFRPR